MSHWRQQVTGWCWGCKTSLVVTTASQLQFAAELATLLVAAAGLVLFVMRSDLTEHARWARPVALAGFVALGAVAFLHGSLLVSGAEPVMVAVRAAGYVALAVTSLGWWGRVSSRLFPGGAALGIAGSVFSLFPWARSPANAALLVAAVALGVALGLRSRHSIVARLAATAAGALLVFVLVLAVTLSAVIADSSQRYATNDLRSRAQFEDSQALQSAQGATEAARFVAADLTSTYQTSNPNPLIVLASGTGPAQAPAAPPPNGPVLPPNLIEAASSAVRGRLSVLSDLYPVHIAYLAGMPTSEAVSAQLIYPPSALSQASSVPLLQAGASSSILTGLSCQAASSSAQITVLNNTLVALAAYPVCLNSSSLLGVVEVVSPLDQTYLKARSQAEASRSLSVVTPAAVLAKAGNHPDLVAEKELATQVEATAATATTTKDGWIFAAEPLYGTPASRTQAGDTKFGPAPNAGIGEPVAALVVSSSAQDVTNERRQLDETLFLIALGGTVIALLLVASVGQRITGGLRRLTRVAERVRAGDTGERSDMRGSDEVSTLGATFDSMMNAVEQQTLALQEAADDETRLRNRLQAVVAGMGDALIAGDEEGWVTEWNNAAADLLEVRAADAIGRPLVAVVTLIDEDGQSLAEEFVKPSPKRWAVTATLLAPGGAEIPVAVSRGPLRGPAGEVAGTVLVMRDLRREREVDRMKSEFLSRVGHELRTPLTGIIGYAEILMARSVPAPMAGQWHGEILGSAKRLLRIVELLEFFAGAGAGRIMVRLEPLDVRVLARGVASAWAERTGGDPEVVRRVARHTPMVLGDQRWLTMAIDELIDNAVKFSPKGGRVLLVAGPAADGGVEISVVDRGMGMSREEVQSAFDDFGQGDSSDTRQFGGLGLGLSLVRRVAEEHNGTVHASSERGVGSTFTMHLPAVSELGGEKGRTDTQAAPTSPPAGGQ